MIKCLLPNLFGRHIPRFTPYRCAKHTIGFTRDTEISESASAVYANQKIFWGHVAMHKFQVGSGFVLQIVRRVQPGKGVNDDRQYEVRRTVWTTLQQLF